jgi:phage/plasmid-like protein (TIGR03299 family)
MTTTAVLAPSDRVNPFLTMGKSTEGLRSAHDVLLDNGLMGWNVRKVDLAGRERGRLVGTVPGQYGVAFNDPEDGYRTHMIPATVGGTWTPIQNEAHAGFLDDLVDESGANYYAAGHARDHRMVFVTMKLPTTMHVGGVDGDPVDLYLNGINLHGDGSLKVMVTPVRWFCTNMIQWKMALQTIKIRHTVNALANLEEARRVLALSFKALDTFSLEAERMIQTTVTDAEFEAIVRAEYGPAEDAAKASVTRATAKVDTLLDLWAEGSASANIRNTAWAAYNTIVEYADHAQTVHGVDEQAKAVARVERSLVGHAATDVKERAWSLFAPAALVAA